VNKQGVCLAWAKVGSSLIPKEWDKEERGRQLTAEKLRSVGLNDHFQKGGRTHTTRVPKDIGTGQGIRGFKEGGAVEKKKKNG